ncbi:hypothetical protein OS493_030767 [Desmophyllum pertusum]|uniref:Secreted protein n=1 Tax=Desmophyllum pertusum TaxID=174260 RepID=A0A9W9YW93_9CNID|nr:hypothetical protein OS493_030767 [Desmophyllum pertusum]
MRSVMVCLFMLSFGIAVVTIAVDGGNTSSVSNKTTAKLDDRTIICNVVQEAIKSLEATLLASLEKKFEQLIAAMNRTTHGNPSGQLFGSCKDIYENHK